MGSDIFTFDIALPARNIIPAEFVEDLEAALQQFAAVTRVKERPGFPIATDLRKTATESDVKSQTSDIRHQMSEKDLQASLKS